MAMTDRSAEWPWRSGVPPHLPRPALMPKAFLLPGDPRRVDFAASVLRDFAIVGQNREFRLGCGYFGDVLIGVCSTGIGGASAEIATVELAAMGATILIRTGGCGALADDLSLGDFLIADEAVRNSGVAAVYEPDRTRPVHADSSVSECLMDTCRSLGLKGRRGRCLTADGYYRAQGRPTTASGRGNPALLDSFATAGADAVEMEAEVIFAVACACGVRAGAILAVHAHRRSDGWLEDYEPTQRNLLRAGAQAAAAVVKTSDQ
ncbi:uridine phosphorylase [Mesorhizobium sp. L-8-3]|nr:uridine phosphorylase [Mesorhizobium sp. L-8-3]